MWPAVLARNNGVLPASSFSSILAPFLTSLFMQKAVSYQEYYMYHKEENDGVQGVVYYSEF